MLLLLLLLPSIDRMLTVVDAQMRDVGLYSVYLQQSTVAVAALSVV